MSWIYGKYSCGSGGMLPNPDTVCDDIGSRIIIESYKKTIKRDLERVHVSPRKKTIMNVGTGREAIALCELGAKEVWHFDLSKENIERMKEFLGKNNYPIVSRYANLVTRKIQKKFDFVYLQGIVQHFFDVGKGLMNCFNALKENSEIWFSFYRSGTFYWYVVSIIRNLIEDIDEEECFLKASSLFTPHFVSAMMDNFFAPINLYTPTDYINFCEECGMEIVFTFAHPHEDGEYSRDTNFNAYPSVILFCRKKKEGRSDILSMSPKDQLVESEITNFYQKLKKLIPHEVKLEVAFRLYRFLIEGRKDEDRSEELQQLLLFFINLFKKRKIYKIFSHSLT